MCPPHGRPAGPFSAHVEGVQAGLGVWKASRAQYGQQRAPQRALGTSAVQSSEPAGSAPCRPYQRGSGADGVRSVSVTADHVDAVVLGHAGHCGAGGTG